MLPKILVNNVSFGLKMETLYPNRIALLFGFGDDNTDPKGLDYSCDNNRYPCWKKGIDWNEGKFISLLDGCLKKSYSPKWVVVPDVVTNAKETLLSWKYWAKRLDVVYGFPLALAVQDGMTVRDVQKLKRQPDVIFVGGSRKFKWRTAPIWCENFPYVHIGRVGSYKGLWQAHRLKAKSTDCSCWWLTDTDTSLFDYLSRSEKGQHQTDLKGFYDAKFK